MNQSLKLSFVLIWLFVMSVSTGGAANLRKCLVKLWAVLVESDRPLLWSLWDSRQGASCWPMTTLGLSHSPASSTWLNVTLPACQRKSSSTLMWWEDVPRCSKDHWWTSNGEVAASGHRRTWLTRPALLRWQWRDDRCQTWAELTMRCSTVTLSHCWLMGRRGSFLVSFCALSIIFLCCVVCVLSAFM